MQSQADIKQLERQYNQLDDRQQYYMGDDKSKSYFGSYIKSSVIKPQIQELRSGIRSYETGIKTFESVPSDTQVKYIRDQGYEIDVRDSSLDWSKGEFKKIERAYEEHGPIVGGLAEIGYGISSFVGSLAKESVRFIPYTGPQIYVPGQPRTLVSPKSASVAQKQLDKIHFSTVTDPLFEPIGLAPEGSGKLVTSHPVFVTTGVALEVASAYGLGKAAEPVTKPLGKFFSKKTDELFTRIRPERAFQLKMKPVRMGIPRGKPFVNTRIGMAFQKVGNRFTGLKNIGHTVKQTYKPKVLNWPSFTESNKLVFGGTQKIWMHSEGPSYRALMKGVSSGGIKFGYDPLKREVVKFSGSKQISKPSMFRGVDVTYKIDRFSYGFVENVYHVKPKYINTGFWRTESATASLVRPSLKVKPNVPLNVLQNMPSTVLVPGTVSYGGLGTVAIGTGILTGVRSSRDIYIPSQRSMDNVVPVVDFKPNVKFLSINQNIVGNIFDSVFKPIQFSSQVSSTKQAVVSKQSFKPVSVQKFDTVKTGKTVRSSIGLWLPSRSLGYPRGGGGIIGLLGLGYRFRKYSSGKARYVSPFKNFKGVF